MIKFCILVLTGIVACQAGIVAYKESDRKCDKLGGVCQDDGNICSGSYYSGKCSGPANRRCCTKTPKVWYSSAGCGFAKVIARDSWGARRPKNSTPRTTPVPNYFIHHTSWEPCTTFSTCVSMVKDIQNFHMDTRGWDDIGYNFAVGEDGRIYEGRGWDKVGAHARGYNTYSVGVAFMGTFDTREPTLAAQKAVKKLLKCGLHKKKISYAYAVFGHKDVGDTTCPGNALYNVIKTWPRFHAHPAK